MRFQKTNINFFYIVHVAEKSHNKFTAWSTAAQHQFASSSLKQCEDYIKLSNSVNRLTNMYDKTKTNKLWWVAETDVRSGKLTRSLFYTSNKELTKITNREAILFLDK